MRVDVSGSGRLAKIESQDIDARPELCGKCVAPPAWRKHDGAERFVIETERQSLRSSGRRDLDCDRLIDRLRARQGDVRLVADRPPRVSAIFRLSAAPAVTEKDVVART